MTFAAPCDRLVCVSILKEWCWVFEQRQANTQCTSTMGKEGRRGAWVRQTLGSLDFLCDSKRQGQQIKKHDLMSLSSFFLYMTGKKSEITRKKKKKSTGAEGREKLSINFSFHILIVSLFLKLSDPFFHVLSWIKVFCSQNAVGTQTTWIMIESELSIQFL